MLKIRHPSMMMTFSGLWAVNPMTRARRLCGRQQSAVSGETLGPADSSHGQVVKKSTRNGAADSIGHEKDSLKGKSTGFVFHPMCMYIYIYICLYMSICVSICLYIYSFLTKCPLNLNQSNEWGSVMGTGSRRVNEVAGFPVGKKNDSSHWNCYIYLAILIF